jgi:hypothetical protein
VTRDELVAAAREAGECRPPLPDVVLDRVVAVLDDVVADETREVAA